MLPYVAVGLSIVEKMEASDTATKGVIMRFCKLYPPEKIGKIVEVAQAFPWWRDNPKAAFMKAVGIVNKQGGDSK